MDKMLKIAKILRTARRPHKFGILVPDVVLACFAYGERMTLAVGGGNSRLREMLGLTAWIDIDAPSADKWVAEEGRLIDQILHSLLRHYQALADLYIISPIRVPSGNLKALLARKDAALSRVSQRGGGRLA